MSKELTFNSAGDLVVPKELLGILKSVDPSLIRARGLYEDLLICRHDEPGERSKPLLYGDLRLFHVAEMMALISSMRKDGSLSLLVPHAKKKILFRAGEIIAATSTVEDDRLGEVLWRMGLLTLDQLSEVHDLVGPKKKLGAVLVERDLITPRQLYDGVKEQILEIVYSTFHFTKGEFVFVERQVPQKSKVRLDMSTRQVIKEGIRRVEEMMRLEERFPDRKSVLVPRPVVVDAQLDDHQKHLLGLVDGSRCVGDIIEKSHLGEFEALKALAKLRQVGLIDERELAAEEDDDQVSLPDVLDEYSKILRLVHQTIKVESPGSETRMEAYIGSPPEKQKDVFAGVGFDADGQLDMETLYRNARDVENDDPRKLALDALQGLYDYAIFQAVDVLEEDVCDKMMNRLRKIRNRKK
jgi:hypothetical protein